MIELNQEAPDFTLPDSLGNTIRLSSFRGEKNIVLIIYPGDDTPVCTTQLKSVRDNYKDFEALNTVVFGVNHGSASSHNAFIEKHSLKNPLLVDENRKVIEAYGALKADENGEPQIERSVIIIDKEGTIRYIERGKPEHEEIKKVLEQINH